MKRAITFTYKALLIGIFLIILLFSGFRVKEHIQGNKYITYLENNIESVPLDNVLSFDLADEDISDYQLILVGEIHGFKESTKFEPEFFEYLHTTHQVNDYLIEMDMSQAYFMNKYNKTGDEEILDRVLKKWVVFIGRENEDYRKKWKSLKELYTKYDGFTYHGNNNISDVDLLIDYINEIMKTDIDIPIDQSDSVKLLSIRKAIREIDWTDSLQWEKEYIISNIDFTINKKYREEVLTENLANIYGHFNLEEKKVFGFYGLGHTVLSPFNDGYTAMASRFASLVPDMKGKILSFNFVFIDSYMTTYSKSLPSFLRDKGKFTSLSVSYDNILLSYLHGIDELKRVTEKETKTLIKLNGKDSPYNSSRRLISMSKVLPIGMVINGGPNQVTTDYYQYLILIRNSEGAKGIE
ncbi:hypothetical protein AAGF08_02115 [Algoriphagus sp. SE2]|uniref:hypothetical protein n=1 Tax=Algoriphagus sp. SE2 TaxID=3141536 RepID=UPI0031CCFD10